MKERIKQLEEEIKEFDFKRLTCQEKARRIEIEIQQELAQIQEGILTRRGGLIELRRLEKEEDKTGL